MNIEPQDAAIAMIDRPSSDAGPLKNLEQWEDDLKRRYPEPANELAPNSTKTKDQFRDYRAEARPEVKEFYRLHHKHQTVDFVRAKQADYLRLDRREMGLWDGLEFLNTLVDDSDPDTSLPQIDHLLQTAEAIRGDGHPRWFILAGLVHDFGKVLCLFGEPQWAVVGDTFPVGCAYSEKIVFSEFLAENPDSRVSEYQTPCGIYEEGCGLDNVLVSWGHDEYMYHVVKDYLPPEALYMIRYHSCYPVHREGAYAHLLNDADRKYLGAVRAFNRYDLYTKAAERPDAVALRPYYEELWKEFFPERLAF
jgi:inositol oxygenase